MPFQSYLIWMMFLLSHRKTKFWMGYCGTLRLSVRYLFCPSRSFLNDWWTDFNQTLWVSYPRGVDAEFWSGSKLAHGGMNRWRFKLGKCGK